MEQALNGTVLIVDDDERFRELCRDISRNMGLDARIAGDGREGLDLLRRIPFSLALVDLKMPRMGGMEFLSHAREITPELPVIIITGYSSLQTAVDAMRMGAVDYIPKPGSLEQIQGALARALQQARKPRQAEGEERGRFGIIGTAPSMQPVYERIEAMRDSDNTVLIMGESGTGKELVAKAIHYYGSRASEPFIPIDCSALGLTVVESELFGHVKGAFTDAHYAKAGLLKLAGRGTVFLDEITEIPVQAQAKLLRAIQEREIRPVGGSSIENIEARIIAATNRDLRRAVAERTFREDLFYRLHVIPISVPPLRERREDIPLLAGHFIEKYNTERKSVRGITDEALSLLAGHRWDGNVRELENAVQAAIALGRGEWITHFDLPPEVRSPGSAPPPATHLRSLQEVEREAIEQALRYCSGRKLEAARILGIGKTTLYEKIRKYGIDVSSR
ncbi:MAG: sigma-54-dependent transcriptional regulator [Spirochaetota bacterium]